MKNLKNVIILTPSLIDFLSGDLKIGGLETYIKDLALLCKNAGYNVLIYQSSSDCTVEGLLDDISVYPFSDKQSYQESFDSLYAQYNDAETIFIIATDQLDIKSKASNVISIQHGIAFDIPGNLIGGFWGRSSLLQHMNKFLRCIKNMLRLYNTKNTVCVDYNYYNWFRTLGTISEDRNVTVIPNYTSNYLSEDALENKLFAPHSKKKIVFSRRFVEHRGTLMFANVVRRLLSQRDDVDITFAGSGPLEGVVRQMFAGDERVHFSSFNAAETIAFHREFDVAVVPTIFSEGTSLSLCEAMAAGCLGVSTYVGGLTNILIDHYNGFMCAPSEDSLYSALVKVLDLPHTQFKEITYRGYYTVRNGFSHELWCEKWLQVLTDFR